MQDIPQPPSEPYQPGDVVRIYLDPNDPDAKHHNTRCRVLERLQDDLDKETGRSTDQYSYRLVRSRDNEVLDVEFRHADLVPDNPRS